MSAEDEVRKLTIDPGPIALARLFDGLLARVDACCGGGSGSNASKAQPKSNEPAALVPTKEELASVPKT